MPDLKNAIVTARFELPAKWVPRFEAMLRDLTSQIACTVLEVSHDEQVVLGIEPNEVEGRRGRDECPDGGFDAGLSGVGVADANEDGSVAGSSGQDGSESLERSSDDGVRGTVQEQGGGDLEVVFTEEASTLDSEEKSAKPAKSLTRGRARK